LTKVRSMPALFAHASWLPAFFTSARSKQTISFDSRTRMLCSQRRQSDQPFGFGWLPRISRNSRGPLMRRRFRSCRSSAVADGSPILSIRRPAMSEAFAAAFRLVCFAGSEPTSPSSTRRRMASEREAALLRAAHRSIACVSSTDKRIAETGACPVAGRPLFFRFTGIENFMIYLYYKKESRARCGPRLPRAAMTCQVVFAPSSRIRQSAPGAARPGPLPAGRPCEINPILNRHKITI
jgi:hypothetical protein